MRRAHPRCPPNFRAPTASLPLGLVRSICFCSHPALPPPRSCLLLSRKRVHLKDNKVVFPTPRSLQDSSTTSLLLCTRRTLNFFTWHGGPLPPGFLPTFAALSPSAVPKASQRDGLSCLLPILSYKNYSSSVEAPFGPQVTETLHPREWPRARAHPSPGHKPPPKKSVKGQTAE